MIDADAFILIGGRSTRFGSDKATHLIDGKPMALHVADAIRTALPDAPITLIASNGEQFPDRDLLGDLPIATDIRPGFGVWSGLHAALSHSAKEWTFVIACDLIGVTPGLISSLARAAATKETDAAIPRQPDGRLQPLCAFYRTGNALTDVEETIESGGQLPRLDSLVQSLPTIVVEMRHSGSDFLNANSPEDLAAK